VLVFKCSADNDLYRVISAEKKGVHRCDSVKEALAQAPDHSGVLILADGYPEATTDIPDETWEIARVKDLRLYIEYPTAIPGLELDRPTFIKTGPYGAIVERIVVTSEAFGPDLEQMSILASWNCHYLPTAFGEAHLVLAQVAGYDKVVLSLPNEIHPLLIEPEPGRVLVATTKLSNFIAARPGPQAAWQAVWRMILRWLEPDSTPRRLEWDALVRPAYTRTEPLAERAEENLLERACRWIIDSRLLVHPSDERHLDALGKAPLPLPEDWKSGDGRRGILESYSPKQILLDGRQPVGAVVRADSVCQTAMVAAFGAHLFEEKTYADIARKLLDFTYFDSGIVEKNASDPEDPLYGLIRWCAQSDSLYFSDDNARTILGSLTAGGLLGNDRWDEGILKAILADFRTTGRRGFRPNKCLERQELCDRGWRYYWDFNGVDLYAHFHATIWSVFLWLYDKTGFLPLLERARNGLTEMMARSPEAWKSEGGRLDSDYAHLLLPLAWLVRVDGREQHRKWLDQVVRFLMAYQDPSGAVCQVVTSQESTEIRPEDRRIIVHPLRTNEEYGQEEVPIVYQTGDPGTDLLYTLNFAFLGMHEAGRATGNGDYLRAADRIADFLIRVQTQSELRPELNGTWFRGFDCNRWDYWGSDGDWGYGVLTTQTGWTHSLIAATFALRRMKTSLWDLTKTSTVGRGFEAYRSRMIPDDVLCRERK
jgi:hypothetical protein